MGDGLVVAALTKAQIEQIAGEARRSLGLSPDQRVAMTPILEHVLYDVIDGYDFRVVEDRVMGPMDGHTDARRPIVSLKESVYHQLQQGDPRARMTAAHEFGHLLMHSTMPYGYASSATYDPLVDPERQAQIFAAAFLMPRSAFVKHRTVRSAMVAFGVSKGAALCRARHLRHRLLDEAGSTARQQNKGRRSMTGAP